MGKKDALIIDELNTFIKDQHMEILVRDNLDIYCRFDSIYAYNLYGENKLKCFPDGFKKALWIIDSNATGKRAKRIPLSFDSREQKNAIIDTLCHQQMIVDYMNNLYDVKTKENAETLMAIEQQLGIKDEKKQNPIDSFTSEDPELFNDVGKIKCEMLGLPIDKKYYTMGEEDIRKEIQKYHPNWTTLEIANRYAAAIQHVAEYVGTYAIGKMVVDSAKNTSKSAKDSAYNYLNFLTNEYQFIVTEIRRIDATTFEATFEIAPRGTTHKIIIHYRQVKPYECVRDIQFVS